MSDNVRADAATTSGALFATDECSLNGITVHVPITKLGYGALDSVTLVSSTDGLPVQIVGTPSVTAAVTNAGTFAVQAAQSGVWNVTNISGTVSLPTGAATAAKQPALGTAGTASADVISVQGIAGMTALKVDGSAVTQPVSGTVTANAGSGTFAISATALPLPAGASTSAKQPALGTAGTASSDVLTVQGIASMTALKVDGSAVTQPVSGTVAATQSGTWNVGTLTSITNAVAVTDNSGSLTVDGTVTANAGTGTFAVSAASLPLPTGAATETTLSTLNGKVTACNTGAVTVSSAPVRTATADTITAKLATDTIQNGTTALTPKFAVISCASSGDNTIVAAVTSKKIRVLSVNFVCSAATNVYFTSGAAGTAIYAGSTNKANFAANSGLVLGFNPVGWFETASGVALVMNLSAANATGGTICYVEV